MFSIGEFARMGTVSIRALRHYDEIGLLRPAQVDPETGYRSYSADQLGQLNRIIALKDLGFSLTQTGKLLGGITVDELRGMLTLRRAQLERELDEYTSRLLGVEARLRYIEGEDAMPADDIMVKKVPEMGVVAIGASAPGYRPEQVIDPVNRSRMQFDELGIPALIKVTGPYMLFFEDNVGDDITVYVALPVAEEPAELPVPARYMVLPEIEAVVAVRNGRASSIFPAVFHDLVHYANAHGYQTHGPGRDIWIHEIDDVSQVEEQVFEIQVPFTRPEAVPA
jgi:DNA-binding transcriptional MerR regulator/effector-binding domain-containing protein